MQTKAQERSYDDLAVKRRAPVGGQRTKEFETIRPIG